MKTFEIEAHVLANALLSTTEQLEETQAKLAEKNRQLSEKDAELVELKANSRAVELLLTSECASTSSLSERLDHALAELEGYKQECLSAGAKNTNENRGLRLYQLQSWQHRLRRAIYRAIYPAARATSLRPVIVIHLCHLTNMLLHICQKRAAL